MSAHRRVSRQKEINKDEKKCIDEKDNASANEKRESEKIRGSNSLYATLDNYTPVVIQGKLEAVKAVHDQKVRTLMRSINLLQEQVTSLKSQDKEHRRSALIQNLRKHQKEQDYIIDILKETLIAKIPDFQESLEMVNDFILKKTIGGPKRFRPKTREELENELCMLQKRYDGAIDKLKHADEKEKCLCTCKTQRSQEDEIRTTDLNMTADCSTDHLAQELEVWTRLASSREITIQEQHEEIGALHIELDKLRINEEKLFRKKKKISILEATILRLQDENSRLIHEKVVQREQLNELQDKIQFLSNTAVEDLSSENQVQIEQLESIRKLRDRELELQDELETQQRKWAKARTTMQQEIATLEKKIEALEAVKKELERSKAEVVDKLDKARQENSALQDVINQLSHDKEMEVNTSTHPSNVRTSDEKHDHRRIMQLELLLAEKEDSVKKTTSQLNAAKLLARQEKKEKEQLLQQLSKIKKSKE